MSVATEASLAELSAGVVLACAVLALWRRDLRALVAVLALQGIALASLVAVLAVADGNVGLGAVAGLVLLAKGIVIPGLLARVVRHDPGSREAAPLVNVPASLVAAAALVALAYLSADRLVAAFPSPLTRLATIGLATVLLGFLLLVTRQKAVSQIVGLLVLDNGIALVAFVLTAGVPLLVELGSSLDVLLVVVVLQVLATSLRTKVGHLDLDQLRELHD